MKRIIAVDYGQKRVGIAVSDASLMLASPWKTLEASKKMNITAELLVKEFLAIQKEKGCEISKVIIGLPLMMSGKQGAMADEVTAFADLLRGMVDFEIVLWDERLSSVQAERSMMEGGHLSRKQRSKLVDKVAAVIILQGYLDSLS